MKTEKEFKYDPIGSWANWPMNPYTICFIYTKHANRVVKGGSNDVEKYIKENFKFPAICHHTYFYHGSTRRHINCINFNKPVYVGCNLRRAHERSKDKYCLMIGGDIIATFRRIPRKWLRQLNNVA